MSSLLKTTVLILGVLLAAAAVVSLALAWTGRPTVTSGQTALETPTTRPPRERQMPVDHGPSAGIRTATFALG